jgi:signal transduction protein with GAF and PtsI domain
MADLERQVVLQGVCAADGVAEAQAADDHPAAVLRRVPHADGVLRVRRQQQPCKPDAARFRDLASKAIPRVQGLESETRATAAL